MFNKRIIFSFLPVILISININISLGQSYKNLVGTETINKNDLKRHTSHEIFRFRRNER